MAKIGEKNIMLVLFIVAMFLLGSFVWFLYTSPTITFRKYTSEKSFNYTVEKILNFTPVYISPYVLCFERPENGTYKRYRIEEGTYIVEYWKHGLEKLLKQGCVLKYVLASTPTTIGNISIPSFSYPVTLRKYFPPEQKIPIVVIFFFHGDKLIGYTPKGFYYGVKKINETINVTPVAYCRVNVSWEERKKYNASKKYDYFTAKNFKLLPFVMKVEEKNGTYIYYVGNFSDSSLIKENYEGVEFPKVYVYLPPSENCSNVFCVDIESYGKFCKERNFSQVVIEKEVIEGVEEETRVVNVQVK